MIRAVYDKTKSSLIKNNDDLLGIEVFSLVLNV